MTKVLKETYQGGSSYRPLSEMYPSFKESDNLFRMLNAMPPVGSIFDKVLFLGPKDGFVKVKIVYRTNTHELGSGERGTLSPHQSTAGLAERIRHCPACDGSLVLTPCGEIVGTSSVPNRVLLDSKVGSKHAVAYLSTIGTIAQKGCNHSRCFQWLRRHDKRSP